MKCTIWSEKSEKVRSDIVRRPQFWKYLSNIKTKWVIFCQIFVTIWTLEMSKYRNSILELIRRPRSGLGRYDQTDHQPKVVVIQKNDDSLWTCLRSKVSERLSCDESKKNVYICKYVPLILTVWNYFAWRQGFWNQNFFYLDLHKLR